MTRNIPQLKRQLKWSKKNRAPPQFISEMKSKLSSAVCSSKYYYFKTVLSGFTKNAPEKFWGLLERKKETGDETGKMLYW